MASQNAQAVIDGTIGYHFNGLAQPYGKLSSQMLWNPPESGVYMAIKQLWFYTSINTAINMKRRTTTLGTGGSLRNQAFFPGNGTNPASTPIEQYSDITATATPSGAVMTAFQTATHETTFEYPFVLGPGEGVIFYPDTAQALNWTLSAIFEVIPIPTP